MTNGSSGQQQHEHFFVQIDGRTKSGHRRFIDALRAGLQLRDQFPGHIVIGLALYGCEIERL